VRAFRLLLLDATVVAAGLFAYDRLVPPPREGDDARAAGALERLEEQMGALERRTHVAPGGRPIGIADMVRALDLGLSDEARERLVLVCEGFHEERLRFWRDPTTHGLGQEEYATAYRALLARYEAQIREIVTGPEQQAAVIRRFIGDGRVVRRTIR
jgi:hypothetical protein